jgi:hypothetical protein
MGTGSTGWALDARFSSGDASNPAACTEVVMEMALGPLRFDKGAVDPCPRYVFSLDCIPTIEVPIVIAAGSHIASILSYPIALRRQAIIQLIVTSCGNKALQQANKSTPAPPGCLSVS